MILIIFIKTYLINRPRYFKVSSNFLFKGASLSKLFIYLKKQCVSENAHTYLAQQGTEQN